MKRIVDRPEWRLHARLQSYKNRVRKSMETVERWLSRCKNPYIALSGGKDSTACWGLIQRLGGVVQPVYFDDEWEYPQTTDYLTDIPGLLRIANTAVHAPEFTAWDYPSPPAHLPAGAIWTGRTPGPVWLAQQGYDGAAIGLRMSENRRRKIHICVAGDLFERKNGVVQCYPVARWHLHDVWTFISEQGLSYNAAYDVMDAGGVSLEMQRVGPILTAQAHCGPELTYAFWPGLWNAFCTRHPDARSFGFR